MSLLPTARAPLTGAEIAIVGLAMRVPGARDVETFWRDLCAGTESIARISEDEARAADAPEEWLSNPAHVRAAGLLEGVADFDASFFGYSPREAALLDPQQRHFLELAWEALEIAGYDPSSAPGAVGVFAGAGLPSYLLGNLAPNPALVASAGHFPIMIANDKDFLATRVAYQLDLTGPALTVQTACSTSLVAVHLACQSLIAGECEMAIAGGAAINVRQAAGYLHVEGGIGSPDGHCRAFDAGAAGTVGGSGAGAVVLKRLEDALKDGDTVHAVIKASAINNDGAGKAGFTAPSVDGQARVIAEALSLAGVPVETIGYVEAHGTATALGDPIEVLGLTEAFSTFTDRQGFCALGSVKTNLGHLDVAAGVVGLIKAALCVKHGLIPPSLHYERPNPEIDFGKSPFFVARELSAWEPEGHPRRAGVSAFGIGGTNAHAVLEQFVPEPVEQAPPSPQLLVLSARTPQALERAAARLQSHLERHRDTLELRDVASTLAHGRKAFRWRRAIAASSTGAAAEALGRPCSTEAGRPAVAFLFSGQGAQHPNMARCLYEGEPAFREEVDRCSEALWPHLGLDLRTVLYPPAGGEAEAARRLAETALTQSALFVIGYALARWLIGRGVQPFAMLGHSVGEYVAACLAGVFSLEDALALVAERGRLIQAMPPGRMLAVAAAPEAIALPEGCAIAAINGPERCTVAGPAPAIAALEAQLTASGISARPLETSHAFHSPMIAPAAEALATRIAATSRHAPQLAYLSNVTGGLITPEEATDPAYWARHMLSPVRFADGLAELAAQPGVVFLELGPGGGLARLAAAQAPGRAAFGVLPGPGEDDRRHAIECLGQLWALGAPVALAPPTKRRVPLPPYPFERERYWIDPPRAGAPARRALADWFHVPTWRPLPRRRAPSGLAGSRWLVTCPEGDSLPAALRARGAAVTERPSGRPGTEAFAGSPRLAFVGSGEAEADYLALWEFLTAALEASEGPVAITVIARRLWNVTGAEAVEPAGAALLGLARVAPLEDDRLAIRVIDPGETNDWLDELEREGPAEVALRHGRAWAPAWAASPLPPSTPPRAGGVYLLTGGLGGLGRAVAERLAEAGARLAIVSRRAFPDRSAREATAPPELGWLRTVEARGAEVLLLQADVADEAALRQAIAETEARFGRLDGVYHLAGVAGGGLLRFRTEGEAQAVLRPKIRGTQALIAALGDRSLEFLLLASSTSASVGAPGQADYAAANAYLEAVAEAAPAALHATAVAFGPWREVGMAAAARVPAALAALSDQMLAASMAPHEGLEALDRALATGLPRLLISPVPPDALLAEAVAWRTRWLEARVGPERHARPAIETPYEPPADELEQAIAAVWIELLGVERVGRHDHFFDLGGHSLLAVTLLARIEGLAGRKLPIERLIHGGTIAALAEVIRAAPVRSSDADPILVTLAEGSSGPPLFLIHPSGGAVLCYGELARALGTRRPIFGLQAPGLLGEPPLASVPAMASRYLQAIRAVAPAGPYHLGGWSFGGVVAFEMAAQLAAAGQVVAPVLVLDNLAPVAANRPAGLDDALLARMFLEDLGAITGVTLALPAEPGLEPAIRRAEAEGLLEALGGAEEIERRFAVFRAHLHGAIAYAPAPYAGPVRLLRASARGAGADPTLGWGTLCEDLVVTEVPGDHYTMLSGERAAALAAAMAQAAPV